VFSKAPFILVQADVFMEIFDDAIGRGIRISLLEVSEK
jgi:hypothetical protein